MKIPHSQGGKWPAIENPKLKDSIALHGICATKAILICILEQHSAVLTIRQFFFLFKQWYIYILQELKQQTSARCVCVSSTNQSHSIWERQIILFRQGLFSCFRIWRFVFFFWSPGTFICLGFCLVKFLHWFIITLFHFQHQFWRFPVQCSDFAAQPSPAEHCWGAHCWHINQGRREQFTGRFQLSPVKNVQLGIPFLWNAS